MDLSQFVQLVRATLSADGDARKEAEALYQQAKTGEPESLLVGLMAVVSNDSVDEVVRRQGAVLLRQLVTRTGSDFVFAKTSPEVRMQVATELLRLFQAEANPQLQRKLGEVIAQLASACCDAEDARGWLSGAAGWPDLLPMVNQMSNPTVNSNARSCECALRLLKDMIPLFKDQVVGAANQQHLGKILEAALSHQDVKLRVAAFVLICEIVEEADKKDWAPLTVTVGVLQQVLQQIAEANMQDELQECLGAIIQVAAAEPDFFKEQMAASMQPATLLSSIARSRQGVEAGIKAQALEWIATYAVCKPKWLAKQLPAFATLAIESCMEMMLQMEDSAEELREWAERMDDEEGEEGSDETFHTGEEAVDRIVEALSIEVVSATLISLIGRFASQESWIAKHAALAVIKQTVEYVEDTTHRDEMAKLLLQHTDHPHPRVRYQALNALLQLADDHSPQFQDEWHKIVMPVLLVKMDDPVDRVASMAMSAFVSFGSELVSEFMILYSLGFMEKLITKLQTTNHRMVREESITSIAVVAGAIEKDFAQYYDSIMPLLKQLMVSATGEKEQRLRGKAFECMSLLGTAVGKEKFLADARDAMLEMTKTTTGTSELQREYITEASERICKCLKGDFKVFLPHLLPGIFQSFRMDVEDAASSVKVHSLHAKDEDDEDDYFMMPNAEGKMVKVHSSRLEELEQSISLLHTFCEEMEGAYFDWVPQTAEALLPLLSPVDEVKVLTEDARGAALHTWSMLIKCTHEGGKERNLLQDPAHIRVETDLLRTVLQKAVAAMADETDADSLKKISDGTAECLKNSPPGLLPGEELMQLVQKIFTLMDQSFGRSKEAETAQTSAPDEDEDEEDADEVDEDNCRRSLEDVLGAVMQVAPAEFLQCVPECARRLTEWLANEKNLVLGLWLTCDLLKHLKEQSEAVWPLVFPYVFQSLSNKNPDARTAAAYAVNLAAPLPKFAEAAPGAFTSLAQMATGKQPKKKEEKAKVAMDNAVSSLLTLALHQAGSCPPDVPVWTIVLGKLPLRADDEEAVKVHKKVVELLLEEHPGLLGPDGAHLQVILCALAEVYGDEELSSKETDQAILRVFKSIPQEKLVNLGGGFSEKQQKKVEKMLA